MELIKEWFQRYFSDPQVVMLLMVLPLIVAYWVLVGRRGLLPGT